MSDELESRMVMSIERDRIWVDPDVEVTEAAQQVLKAMEAYIVNMVQIAVREEREACAKVCEELGYYVRHGGWTCADAIRARGEG